MRTIRFALQFVFLLAVAAGCSTTAPDPTFYLMRGAPQEGAGRIDAAIRVGLGRLIVAPYLQNGQGIVVETAPGEVRPARMHQWAEPIESGIRWYLRAEIARALGDEVGGGLVDMRDWDYTIDVYVGRLHGSMQGEALIEAAYVVRPRDDRTQLREYYFSRTEPLPEAGYPGLVAAQQSLLTGLANAIAADLRNTLQGAPAVDPSP